MSGLANEKQQSLYDKTSELLIKVTFCGFMSRLIHLFSFVSFSVNFRVFGVTPDLKVIRDKLQVQLFVSKKKKLNAYINAFKY